MFALPTAILGAAFVEEMSRKKSMPETPAQTCPHCGEEIKP